MSRKIRFPLKMANGADVRSLEEFIENFDIESALGYYEDGKLITWLRDRYNDTEADKLEALDKTAKSFTSDFCAVFGIEAAADDAENGADIDYIARRNEKKRILRTITDDESVIYNVDSVALDQDDLLDIFDEGKKEIYLCQGEFEIPLSVTGVTYHGIADPVVTVRVTDNVNFNEKNIKFVDCVYGWDVSRTTPNDDVRRAENLFLKGDYQKSASILETYAEQGNPRAVMLLCHIYKELLPDTDKLKKWSEKAKQSREVCNVFDVDVIDNTEKDAKKYLTLLKKLADKGNSFDEYYYAFALQLFQTRGYYEENISELIEFYCARSKEMIKYYTLSAEKGNVIAMRNLGFCYDYGRAVLEDKSQAALWYEKAAEMGCETAIIHMAICCKGQDKVKWYAKAAEQGSVEALYEIGEYYNDTEPEKAFDYYLQAAKHGHVNAMIMVQLYYKSGKGVEQDYEKHLYWLTKAAEENSFYWYGLGEKLFSNEEYRDYDKAIKWFTKASENGDFDATLMLAHCYLSGDGVTKNNDKAFEVIRNAADSGNEHAQNILGNIFYNGDIVAVYYDKAVEWYKKAAEKHSKEALYNLAFCYYHGNGVHQSYKKACELLINVCKGGYHNRDIYKKLKNEVYIRLYFSDIFHKEEIDYQNFFDLYKESAEKGDVHAQCMLGDLWYYYGTYDDDDQNYTEAAKWYTKAADQGNVYAQLQLADFYYFGYGVEEDDEQRFDWLLKAAQNGATDSLSCYFDFDEHQDKINIALPIFTKAAENGDEDSADWLGSYYENKGDLEKAIKWYAKADSVYKIKKILLASDDTVTN